jgi:hypothetical protein
MTHGTSYITDITFYLFISSSPSTSHPPPHMVTTSQTPSSAPPPHPPSSFQTLTVRATPSMLTPVAPPHSLQPSYTIAPSTTVGRGEQSAGWEGQAQGNECR